MAFQMGSCVRFAAVASAVLILTAEARDPGDEPEASGRIDFTRTIRPILSDACFRCHGPDEKHRKAKFRLDTRQGAMSPRDEGIFAIVPGKPEESELYRRIASTDHDEVMPPAKSKRKLTRDEIELVRKWIEQGAEWARHWSLVPPLEPAIPRVKDERWVRNDIDRFILSRLEREGLSHSPEADRRTLLRRVAFDLSGLPPEPEDVEAFVNDDSSGAYEKRVDRLLSTSRYGEHMSRYWLDVARYGDTHGLSRDNYREIWPYRDWVISAFNRNFPFDRFIVEQLAGDLLENPTLEQRIATGFNRCHVSTSEGGTIEEEAYVNNVVDRVVTTGTAFLGLTLECSRCHDHKYDPIKTKEFYRLFAFFNNLDGKATDENRRDPAPVVKAPSREQRRRLESLAVAIREIESRMNRPVPELDAAQAVWEREQAKRLEPKKSEAPTEVSPWYTVGPFKAAGAHDAFKRMFPPERDANVSTVYQDGKLKWIPQESWKDGKRITVKGLYSARFLLRKLEAPTAREIRFAFDGDGIVTAWLNGEWLMAKEGNRREEVTVRLKGGENILLVKVCSGPDHSRFKFEIKQEQLGPLPLAVVQALRVARDKRDDRQRRLLRGYYRRGYWPHWRPLEIELDLRRWEKSRIEILAPSTMVFRERAEPRPSYVLERGQYDQRQEEVHRGTPASLPPMDPSLPKNRLGFAKWLLDPGHPLTARVAVNRFWQQVFGTGIVKTAGDFGSQGEPPSHPLLLDYLATQFIADGWDVKKFMKRLVMSAAYRQSAATTPELIERDPGNRLLSRGPRFRLDAEMLRDQALSLSGLLVEKVGGPSVKPPQPGGLWFIVSDFDSNTKHFKQDIGAENLYRRSLYTFWKRTSPPPQMKAFDAPSRVSCVMSRERTNTPLQALLLMNEPQYLEAARALAQRILREGGRTPAARAAWAFRLATARPATKAELSAIVASVEVHLRVYRARPEDASRLVSVGDSEPDPALDPAELAAWTVISNLILNLDEVVTK